MLTFRASLIIFSLTMLLIYSLLGRQESVALISLAALLWVWWEWIVFQVAMLRLRKPWPSCVREIDGETEDTYTLTTECDYGVKVSGVIPKLGRGYRFFIKDMVSPGLQVRPNPSTMVDRGSRRDFVFSYEFSTPICGKTEFPGLHVEVSDYFGFFRQDLFQPIPQEVQILPFLIRPQTTVSVLKQNNLQQLLGHHRHASSGMSSELLGIRDYRPGDPPRTIAWKPTARLGKVMSREFESEVPIRATLIVDFAAYQFQNRPGRSIADATIATAASLGKLLLADRDPVAGVMIGSSHTYRLRHGRGERQLAKLMQYLLPLSNPNPPLHLYPIETLVELVFDNAQRRHPDMFEELFNCGPVRRSLFFKPRRNRVRALLSLVLESLLDMPDGRSNRLQYDDEAMGNACLAYVEKYPIQASASQIRLSGTPYHAAEWRFERQRVVQAISDTLNELRARARDQELFVVIAPEPVDLMGMQFLTASIQAMVAMGNRVVYVAPQWPRISEEILDPVAAQILGQADKHQHRWEKTDFSEKLTELGVAFTRIDDPTLMQIVAAEVGILKSGKGGRRTAATRSRGFR